MVSAVADPFKSFNEMSRRAMNHPLIRRGPLRDLFQELDTLINRGIRSLVLATTFVEDNLCFQLVEIAGGSIQGRKIYRGKQVMSRRDVGGGVEIGAENAKILGAGFDLFKLSRAPREIAAPLTLRTVRALRLANIVYEHILFAFEDETKGYRATVETLVAEHGALSRLNEDAADENEIIEKMQSISALIDKKQDIENAVSCVDNSVLYGIVSRIRRIVSRIRRIKERIVASYLRLVPAIVKSCGAVSDLDALDMFQAGSMGLHHATSIYDYRARTGFPTIAKRWIRQRIMVQRKRTSGPIIKLAPSIWEDYRKILRAKREEIGEEPESGLSHARIAAIIGKSEKRVAEVLETVQLSQVVSIHTDMEREDDDVLDRESMIADESEIDLEFQIEQQQRVLNLLQHLDADSRRLVCLRFGFADGIDNSQIDPQERLREVISQIACKALANDRLAN